MWPAACAVCFGNPHSNQTLGVLAGVGVLLGVTLFVLAGVAVTIFIWARRARHLK